MDVTRVPVGAPTAAPSGHTTAHIIETGEASLLVDPAARTQELDTAVRGCAVGHVAVTHHHPDHVGGVATYAADEDLTVWARAGRSGAFERATGVAPDRLFRAGKPLPVGDSVPTVDTPGHSPEHVAFVAGDAWLTGDLAVESGSVVVGAPDGDMRAYLTSLRRVHARDPGRLLPAHGPVIERPRRTCERLLAHRLDRERRVQDAVLAGHHRPDEIVEAAYEKDVSEVFALARRTVVAHLEKLAHEKRVRWDGDRALPV